MTPVPGGAKTPVENLSVTELGARVRQGVDADVGTPDAARADAARAELEHRAELKPGVPEAELHPHRRAAAKELELLRDEARKRDAAKSPSSLRVDELLALNADLEEQLAAALKERPTLAAKLARAFAASGEVTKSSENRDQGYKFASAEAILAAVRAPLYAEGVVLIPRPSDGGKGIVTEAITSRGGTPGEKITVSMDFTFHDDGPSPLVIKGWQGVGIDYGDKAIGKAYTSCVKTFVRTTWLLPTEHDDPEQDSPDRGSSGGQQRGPELRQWQADATDARIAGLVDALAPLLGGPENVTAVVEAARKQWQGNFPDAVVAFGKALAPRLGAARQGAATRQRQDKAAEAPDTPSPDPEPDPPAPDHVDEPPGPSEEQREAYGKVPNDLPPGMDSWGRREDPQAAPFGDLRAAAAERRRSAEEWAAAAEDGELNAAAQGAEGTSDEERTAARLELECRAESGDLAEPGTVPIPDGLPKERAKLFPALRELGCICPKPLDPPHEPDCPLEGHGDPSRGSGGID